MSAFIRETSVECPWCGATVYKEVSPDMNLEMVVFECINNDGADAAIRKLTGCEKRFIGLILFKVTVEEIQKVFDK